MESNQATHLPRRASVFSEDSYLLSDYLHRQAERAGNRLFSRKNSWLFLRSKIFSSQFEEDEGEKVLRRFCRQGSESMTVGSASLNKESLGSFSGKECSWNVLLEVEQRKGESILSQRSLASSNSCIESSPLCELESGSKAPDRIEFAMVKSLHDENLFCCETKAEISMSSCQTENVKDDADKCLPVEYDTGALDLLVFAAMQANDSDARHDTPLSNSAGVLTSGALQSGSSHLDRNCIKPIFRKRVVRRAKSAFQKHPVDAAAKPQVTLGESLRRNEDGRSFRDQRIAPRRHEVRVTFAKKRKLQDLSFRSADDSSKTCIIKDPICDAMEDTHDIPCTTIEIDEDHGNVINYRKLQTSSSRLFDLYDADQPQNTLSEEGQHRYGALSGISSDNDLTFETPKGVPKHFLDDKCNNKHASCEEPSKADSRITQVDDVKQGNSLLKLRILPVRQPCEDVTMQENGSKGKISDFVAEEVRMLTRNRSAKRRTEKEESFGPLTALPSFRQQELSQTSISQAPNNTDLLTRTKRGRSRVLPTKFSDSVLQPWKTSRRKIRVLDS